MECPNCKIQLKSGYGLAGGGMGPYFYCDMCGYFEKHQDPEMVDDQSSDVPSRE